MLNFKKIEEARQFSLFKRKKIKSRTLIYPEKLNSSLTLGWALANYRDYLLAKPYSLYTVKVFISDIAILSEFFKEKKIGEIGTDDLNFFLSQLKEMGFSPKTISRRTTTLKNFFSWLYNQKVISYNPAEALIYKRVTPPLPQILFEDEQKRLLAEASKDPRNYLIILLLLKAGLKKEELLRIEKSNIDLSDKFSPEIWIHSKNPKKERRLKLPPEFYSAYQEYLLKYSPSERLFENPRRKEIMTERNLSYILSDLAQKSGIKKKVSCQILRDTFAVNQLRAGEKMERVFQKLGLSSSAWNQETREKYRRLSSPAL